MANEQHSTPISDTSSSDESLDLFHQNLQQLAQIPVGDQIYFEREDFDYPIPRAELDQDNLFEFLSAQKQCEYYVDVAISRAVDKVNNILDSNDENQECVYMHYIPKHQEFDRILAENPYEFWPTVENFDKCRMVERILEYISLWRMENEWTYDVTYLTSSISGPSELHRYEALFSLPTPQYPTPQVTASVFFNAEICHCIAAVANVCVNYIFEGQTYEHMADGQYSYQEQILLQIMEGKWKLYQSLKI